MQATLQELAALVGGEVVGDGTMPITGAATLTKARPGEVTLLDKADKRNLLTASRASAVVAPRGFENALPMIRVADVHRAFAQIVSHFQPPRSQARLGVSPLAVVSPTAQIGRDVDIHPFATIGDDVAIGDGSTIHSGVHIMAGSQIGRDVTIFPNAVLYENTIVGPRCVIHANAVLGAYGFGYGFADGRHVLSAQLGNVVLGADVEIGAGTTIDRGTYGPTAIGEGTKIDDHGDDRPQLPHRPAQHALLAGRHRRQHDHRRLRGDGRPGRRARSRSHRRPRRAGRDGRRDQRRARRPPRMIGIPATPERDQKIKQAALSKLPEMRRQLKQLQPTVDELLSDRGRPTTTSRRQRRRRRARRTRRTWSVADRRLDSH